MPIVMDEEDKFLWDNPDEEYHTVMLIKKYLRSPVEKKVMDDLDISIEDMLNGRIQGDVARAFVKGTFDVWNEKLGYKHFGY